jgi:hypothetical protein
MSDEERADELTLSPTIARTRVSRAITRPGARDRAQPVVIAHQTGPMADNATDGAGSSQGSDVPHSRSIAVPEENLGGRVQSRPTTPTRGQAPAGAPRWKGTTQ